MRVGGVDLDHVDLNDTWEFDGQTWRQRTDIGSPPGRYAAQMAYDEARGVMVWFGGSGYTNDTWEYDGMAWREAHPPTPRPPGRTGHSMAYDPLRKRVVMAFGANDSLPAMSDTWEYDGIRWVKAPIQSDLTPRAGAAMAFEPLRGKIYTFGGNHTGTETRFWTGAKWQIVTTTGAPSARYRHTMVFDKPRGKVLLFGGGTNVAEFNDTWLFDGAQWIEVPRPLTVPHRSNSSLVFDEQTGKVLVFGGYDAGALGFTSDQTWQWDGKSWSQRTTDGPGPLLSHASAFDPRRGLPIIYGGWNATLIDRVNDTWAYVSTPDTWETLNVGYPSKTSGSGLAYSPRNQGLILFGGDTKWVRINETWLLPSEGSWQQLFPSTSPSPRHGMAFATDTRRQVIVLYGGWSGPGEEETWEFDGTDWKLIPVSGPGTRTDPAMAFDAAHGMMVLIGGSHKSLSDIATWLYDGTTWTALTTAFQPGMNRSGASATWDSTHQVVLMAGGATEGNAKSYNDLWAFGWDEDGDLVVGGMTTAPPFPTRTRPTPTKTAPATDATALLLTPVPSPFPPK